MGELAVSAQDGAELIAIGLGSCIGLALVDRQARVAGLAHVVLPDSLGKPGPAGKFADLAVPELINQMERAGAVKRRLQAVLVGGARMFGVGPSMDIGARNSEAVRDALAKAKIPIAAEATGGERGRTARVVLGGEISAQIAGGERSSLLNMAAPRGAGRTRIGATS